MSRVKIKLTEKVVSGIYKITSPNGRVYIGQSVNISKRFSAYRNNECNNQHKLRLSFKKYGVTNHRFEIIEKCSVEDLNNREIFYISQYDSTSFRGLNISHGGAGVMRNRKHSEETKGKIRSKKVGLVLSEETKLKMSTSRKKWEHSASSKNKMSINNSRRRKVVDKATGESFIGVAEAAKSRKMKTTTLIAMLKGQNPNKTNLSYL